MRYSIYIDKEKILEDFQVESSIASYFVEKYIHSLSTSEEKINFLDLLKIDNTQLESIYFNYCLTKNINLKDYLMSVPRLKYKEISNFKKPKKFNEKTLQYHHWNQLHYIAKIKKNYPIENYSEIFKLIYEIYKKNNYSTNKIECFFDNYSIDLYDINKKDIDLIHLVFNI